MNGYIKKEDVENAIIGRCEESALYRLRNLPSADVVEVVRCGKCKFHDPNWSSCTYWYDNPFDQQTVKDDDYCSFGKLKEE